MKNLTTGLILIGIVWSACEAQKLDCSLSALHQELHEMEEKDQDIRRELMPILGKYQEDGSGKIKLMMLALKMEKQDAQNQERLLQIFETCGWPEGLNAEAHNTIYLVLQHSPDSIMRRYYPIVEEYTTKGLLQPDDLATMYDRLQMNAGLPQRYGTQTFSDSDSRNMVWPVENPDSLEIFRSSVGLPTMEVYFQLALDSMKVKMYWDKNLTLKEAMAFK